MPTDSKVFCKSLLPDNEFELWAREHDDPQKSWQAAIHSGREHVLQSFLHPLVPVSTRIHKRLKEIGKRSVELMFQNKLKVTQKKKVRFTFLARTSLSTSIFSIQYQYKIRCFIVRIQKLIKNGKLSNLKRKILPNCFNRKVWIPSRRI